MSDPRPERHQVLVVGAGLAGLACARILAGEGLDVRLLERSDAVGGRLRTDEVDGFLLDRGFQVLPLAYEELRRQIDVDRLDLRFFDPGSLVHTGSALHRMVDPFRAPLAALSSVRAPVGSLADKLRVALLRFRLMATDPDRTFEGPERSTLQELRALGFSEPFIDGFFRPFLGGVFLERELATSAALFRYYFRCFAADRVGVPARGMQRLPELLAEPLAGRITVNARVTAVRRDGVTLSGGSELSADHVVLAVDGPASAAFLGEATPPQKAAITLWMAAPEPPVGAPLLVLNGSGSGPVNHLAVMSEVSPDYAPPGGHLVAASAGDGAAADPVAFEAGARRQLESWFGPGVRQWRTLRTDRIPHALPRHPPGSLRSDPRPRHRSGIILAGDHTAFGSIQGALLSGRRAAETVLSLG